MSDWMINSLLNNAICKDNVVPREVIVQQFDAKTTTLEVVGAENHPRARLNYIEALWYLRQQSDEGKLRMVKAQLTNDVVEVTRDTDYYRQYIQGMSEAYWELQIINLDPYELSDKLKTIFQKRFPEKPPVCEKRWLWRMETDDGTQYCVADNMEDACDNETTTMSIELVDEIVIHPESRRKYTRRNDDWLESDCDDDWI